MSDVRKMKDSGVEWIGEIPEEWDVKKLKYLVSLNPEVLGEGTDGALQFGYVDIGSVSFERGIESIQKLSFADAPSRARRIIRKDDVIISTVRTYLKAIAKVTHHELIASTGFAVLRARDIDSLYLEYLCKMEPFIQKIAANSVGISYPAINASQITEIKIPVPSEAEQMKISKFLHRNILDIDTIIEKTKESIEEYKKYKQSLITEVVTKGLNPEVPMRDSGVEWIGEIPEHWRIGRIKNFGEVIIGLTYSPSDVSDHGQLVLRSSNVQNGSIDLSEKVFVDLKVKKKLLLAENDILICSRNGSRALIGKCALVNEENAGHTFGAFMSVLRGDNNRFLYFVLNSNIFNFHIGTFLTSTINQLTTSNLNSIEVAMPPQEEQIQIAEFLQKKISEFEAIIDQKSKLLIELEYYKKSLIYEVVTGKKEIQ